MIKINQLKLTPNVCKEETFCLKQLKKKCAKLLRIQEKEILQITIVRKALDGRKKPNLFYTFSVVVSLDKQLEKRILQKSKLSNVSLFEEVIYRFPKAGERKFAHRPVVVGMGPAGLFCGYYLAKHGYRPILLERGKAVDERIKDVASFWNGGELHPNSNVQFGEGGAGTFSDGKLNTLVKDKYGRHKEVLKCFVEHGAKKEILYESKPHIGTDVLAAIVKNIRNEIISFGGEVRFESQVTDFQIYNNKLVAVEVNHNERIPTEAVVLAIGHSARDTFFSLEKQGVPMSCKPFAVGVRIEHPQALINQSQYGEACPYEMPAADYKLTAQALDGRGVYSFCMCPGGYVVNASSEPKRLAINGMSYSLRDGENANSAMIVTVSPKDYEVFLKREGYDTSIPKALYGIAFQRLLEEKAYSAAQGKIPVQRFEDFQNNQASVTFGKVFPKTKGAYALSNVREILPKEIGDALEEGITSCEKKIHGFAHKDALISAIESRTSSPVRIERDEGCCSSIEGLYPCGEGAGYAGGITSAAIDGIRVAEAVASTYQNYIKETN